jgi:hypothetical protein
MKNKIVGLPLPPKKVAIIVKVFTFDKKIKQFLVSRRKTCYKLINFTRVGVYWKKFVNGAWRYGIMNRKLQLMK